MRVRSAQEDPLPALVCLHDADALGAGHRGLQLLQEGLGVRRVHGDEEPPGGLGVEEAARKSMSFCTVSLTRQPACLLL